MAIANIPTSEPVSFYAGDTLTWKISNNDYPASSGWTLKYILLKSGTQITITSTASGADHLVEVAKGTTANYTAGEYEWRAYFYDSDEQYHYKSGKMTILANWTAQTSGLDTRSHAKTVLDAIEALMEGKASLDQMSIKIGDREISRLSPKQLIEWRNFYRDEYLQEINNIALENGEETDNHQLYGRFV